MTAPDKKEIFRLLGYRGNVPDPASETLADACVSLLLETVRPKSVFRRFPLERAGGRLVLGPLAIESRALERHLRHAGSAWLFAATLGAGIDRLMLQIQAEAIEKAVVMQAVAAAALERYCDDAAAQLLPQIPPGSALLPRFSPGYGDFSVRNQERILRLLDAPRQIGLSVTGSDMLVPLKSITAVIGVCETGGGPSVQGGCGACEAGDCAFRKSDT